MRLLSVLVVCALIATNINFGFAQQAKPILPGVVKGLVKDTTHHYVLKTATISVYKLKDSSLINYQLSNVYGEFNIKNLPTGTPLKLEVSYVGYHTFQKNFTIPSSINIFDFKDIVMKTRDITLNEVAVKMPPISMNGDTLEINPAAFKLDSNAVIEDVLRRTPGITLWGDGTITVNGKAISRVMVDGKQFFGGDPAITLQNINKNAVQKIQVYNQKNEDNPLDSNLLMNVKLKANKKFGMFGKVGAGYGTGKHYEADGNLNVYDTKLQLGIVSASNDINKIANNATTLLANSKFKGTGANVSYQPDFRATGITRPSSGGVIFQYDFKEKPENNKKSTLTANYFAQRRDFENRAENETITTKGENDQIYGSSLNNNNLQSTNQNFDSRYEYGWTGGSFTASQNLARNSVTSNGESLSNSFDASRNLVSNNATRSNGESQNTNYNFNLRFNRNKMNFSARSFRLFDNINGNYTINIVDDNSQRSERSDFKSVVNPATDRKIERRYNNGDKNTVQNLTLGIPSILTSIFKPTNTLYKYPVSLRNTLKLINNRDNNKVQDLETATSVYRDNNYLTNQLRTNQVEERPEISISRSFSKQLSNRFNKGVNLNVGLAQLFVFQDNRSSKSFQNIKKNYSNFVPSASISGYHYKYGQYSENLNVNYTNEVYIPTMDQLAPLTDSINVYSLRLGNLNLKESRVQALNLSFNHSDLKNKNTFNFNASVNAQLSKNGFADSSFVDAQNRRASFVVNINGQKSLSANLGVNKAYKTKAGEFQFRLNMNARLAKSPGYTNGVLNFSNTQSITGQLNVFYRYKELLAIEANTSYSPTRSRQLAFNTDYKTANYSNALSASYNFTKKLTVNSNISYNRSTSNTTESINYSIWNASASYRFLKGNNIEFKVAALDILHQNTSVLNFASANYLRTGTQTVLQQYFMTSLAYYPRMFGKPGAKK